MAWVRLLAALLCLWAGQGIAAEIRVIDGDTFDLGGDRVRLLNIDAPELGQTCRDRRGRNYRCGEAAANALRALLASGSVRCVSQGRDDYDRVLAHCTAAGRDIGAQLVSTGVAVAFTRYSEEYLPQQVDAFKAGAGLWAGSFQMPWEFRAERWERAAQQVPRGDCPIKGNINRKGEKIYHTPYSRHYDRTRINERNGERWFCDEAEALAAGWRPPIW